MVSGIEVRGVDLAEPEHVERGGDALWIAGATVTGRVEHDVLFAEDLWIDGARVGVARSWLPPTGESAEPFAEMGCQHPATAAAAILATRQQIAFH